MFNHKPNRKREKFNDDDVVDDDNDDDDKVNFRKVNSIFNDS